MDDDIVNLSIPTLNNETITINCSPKERIYFIGANGSGKTRLAVYIENKLGAKAHRIAAHRNLTLNPTVDKISATQAKHALKQYTPSSAMMGASYATVLFSNYNAIIQLLFANQSNIALQTHNNAHAKNDAPLQKTFFQRLNDIWNRIFPNKQLLITGDDIQVQNLNQTPYSASEMSDGERSVFYLLGQTFVADSGTVLIFDEPEQHLHRSIMSRLWDELETARPDCVFITISHDLEFLANRYGQKYILKAYDNQKWDIQELTENNAFSEELTTLILGSRQPILFIEGNEKSLDLPIYRACYPDWTIIPRNSCEEVMYAVITLNHNKNLHHYQCAGIIDGDDYSDEEKKYFSGLNIYPLAVSEIENIFLLEDVLAEIAKTNHYQGVELEELVKGLINEVFIHPGNDKNQQQSLLRYARRRIDRTLKKIDCSEAEDESALITLYESQIEKLKIDQLIKTANDAIQSAIAERDTKKLLQWYDHKGLLAIACKTTGMKVTQFKEWIVRYLRNEPNSILSKTIQKHLPNIKSDKKDI